MKIPTQKGEHSCKCRVVPLMKTGNLSKLMYNIWISTCVHSTMQLLPSQYLSRILQRTQCCNESLIVAMTKMYWNFLYRYGLEDKTIQVAQWRVWLAMWRLWVWGPSKLHVVSFSKKLYPYCLVLVGYRNGLERDFTIELK